MPLKIRIRNELLPMNLLVILLIAAIFLFPYDVLRISIGIPFVLFFPGYALVAALFPRREGIGGIERLVLSFVLSIAVVPLIGLILNYTPWGIRLEPMLCSMASFIFITSVIAWFRRKRLLEKERFSIEFHLTLPDWRIGARDKVLSVLLVLVILGTLGTLGYIIATPKVGERFTEFYILGMGGQAAEYPEELKVGEEGKVIVGIINHEHQPVTYRVNVIIDGEKGSEIEPVVLEHDEKWEEEISFVPKVAGQNQKVDFLLHKNGEAKPYLEPLRLWLNVRE